MIFWVLNCSLKICVGFWLFGIWGCVGCCGGGVLMLGMGVVVGSGVWIGSWVWVGVGVGGWGGIDCVVFDEVWWVGVFDVEVVRFKVLDGVLVLLDIVDVELVCLFVEFDGVVCCVIDGGDVRIGGLFVVVCLFCIESKVLVIVLCSWVLI